MAVNFQTENQSLAELATGIVSDAERLLRQEVELVKREMKQEVAKAKTAAVNLAIGGVIAGLGAVLLSFMLVYLLQYFAGEHIPLWGCFGIVGGVIAAAGAFLLYTGAKEASEVSLVPEQAIEALQETANGPGRARP